VGNGWEWTQTPFAPLPGFTAWARTYPGYSADFFDGEHDVVFGASWATDAKLARSSFRNWYRRDYPYVFGSFRVARSVPSS
jgi:formylglycine-generating enzyme required for sulfatase activity